MIATILTTCAIFLLAIAIINLTMQIHDIKHKVTELLLSLYGDETTLNMIRSNQILTKEQSDYITNQIARTVKSRILGEENGRE